MHDPLQWNALCGESLRIWPTAMAYREHIYLRAEPMRSILGEY